MILTTLDRVPAADFAAATGWDPRPQGLCRGPEHGGVCVPAPGALRDDGTIDIEVAGRRLGMPLVHDAEHDVWALGPATVGGTALATAAAADPELVLRDGSTFRLSELRGRKVVFVAWSTY
jgi:hypothetical protein